MWSESPIRYPRRRTAVSGAPVEGEPPTAALRIAYGVDGVHESFPGTNIGPAELTMPAWEGTSALIILVGRGVFGLEAPDGWQVLDSGAGPIAPVPGGSGAGIEWLAAAVTTADSGTDRTFRATEWATHDGTVYSLYMFGYQFSGGSGGWFSVSPGPQAADQQLEFAPPITAPVRGQETVLTGSGGWSSTPPPGMGSLGSTYLTSAPWPGVSASGLDFQDLFEDLTPQTAGVAYPFANLYGPAAWLSFAWGWTPAS